MNIEPQRIELIDNIPVASTPYPIPYMMIDEGAFQEENTVLVRIGYYRREG